MSEATNLTNDAWTVDLDSVDVSRADLMQHDQHWDYFFWS